MLSSASWTLRCAAGRTRVMRSPRSRMALERRSAVTRSVTRAELPQTCSCSRVAGPSVSRAMTLQRGLGRTPPGCCADCHNGVGTRPRDRRAALRSPADVRRGRGRGGASRCRVAALVDPGTRRCARGVRAARDRPVRRPWQCLSAAVRGFPARGPELPLRNTRGAQELARLDHHEAVTPP